MIPFLSGGLRASHSSDTDVEVIITALILAGDSDGTVQENKIKYFHSIQF